MGVWRFIDEAARYLSSASSFGGAFEKVSSRNRWIPMLSIMGGCLHLFLCCGLRPCFADCFIVLDHGQQFGSSFKAELQTRSMFPPENPERNFLTLTIVLWCNVKKRLKTKQNQCEWIVNLVMYKLRTKLHKRPEVHKIRYRLAPPPPFLVFGRAETASRPWGA